MKKRYKLHKRSSRKLFTKTAKKVHKRNIPARSLRGGIRL